jgi:hypothetical protein
MVCNTLTGVCTPAFALDEHLPGWRDIRAIWHDGITTGQCYEPIPQTGMNVVIGYTDEIIGYTDEIIGYTDYDDSPEYRPEYRPIYQPGTEADESAVIQPQVVPDLVKQMTCVNGFKQWYGESFDANFGAGDIGKLEDYKIHPTISASVNSARPGEPITITGKNFDPEKIQSVRVEIHSVPLVIDKFLTNSDGSFSSTFKMPSYIPLGDHKLVVKAFEPGSKRFTFDKVEVALFLPLKSMPSLVPTKALCPWDDTLAFSDPNCVEPADVFDGNDEVEPEPDPVVHVLQLTQNPTLLDADDDGNYSSGDFVTFSINVQNRSADELENVHLVHSVDGDYDCNNHKIKPFGSIQCTVSAELDEKLFSSSSEAITAQAFASVGDKLIESNIDSLVISRAPVFQFPPWAFPLLLVLLLVIIVLTTAQIVYRRRDDARTPQ